MISKSNVLIGFIIVIVVLISFSCKSKIEEERSNREKQKDNTTDYKNEVQTTPEHNEVKVEKYSYQWINSSDIPPVAIVIDDFGQIGGSLLQGFAQLDKEVTFAVLPDLPNTKKSAEFANDYGHEVIIHIPMEALDKKQNPGKRFVSIGQETSEVKDLIRDFIKQIPHAIGANNHMGSGATADYKIMHNVLEVLDDNNMFFLDSKTSPNSLVYNVAKDQNFNYSMRDIFLDVPDVSASTLNQKLKELQKFKGRVEPIVIISHCHNQDKLDAMASFIEQLKRMGIKLVPLSYAVKKSNSQTL